MINTIAKCALAGAALGLAIRLSEKTTRVVVNGKEVGEGRKKLGAAILATTGIALATNAIATILIND